MNDFKRFRQVAELLRQDAALMADPVSRRLPTTRDLARHYGVSRLTVGEALNSLVNSGLLTSRARKGFFIREAELKKKRIGFWRVEVESDVVRKAAIRAALEILDIREVELLPLPNAPDGRPPELSGYDGLWLEDAYCFRYGVEHLKAVGCPIVITTNSGRTMPYPLNQVLPSLDDAFAEFSAYCDLRSYSRIILSGGPHHDQEIQIIRRFLCDSGVSATKIRILEFKFFSEFDSSIYFDRSEHCFDANTLLIAFSVQLAYGLYGACRKGNRIPDILTVGYREIYDNKYFQEPYFTTINRRLPEVYSEAGRLLLRLVMGHDSSRNQHQIKVPAEFIIRRSIRHIRKDI